MTIKPPLAQDSLDPLFFKARIANGFTGQPVQLALLEQPRTVL